MPGRGIPRGGAPERDPGFQSLVAGHGGVPRRRAGLPGTGPGHPQPGLGPDRTADAGQGRRLLSGRTMSMRRTGAWLGDVADVIRTLGLTAEDDIQKTASMLGLAYAEAAEAAPGPETIPDTLPDPSPVPAPAGTGGRHVSRLRALAP